MTRVTLIDLPVLDQLRVGFYCYELSLRATLYLVTNSFAPQRDPIGISITKEPL
jgi:hypothetical protein